MGFNGNYPLVYDIYIISIVYSIHEYLYHDISIVFMD